MCSAATVNSLSANHFSTIILMNGALSRVPFFVAFIKICDIFCAISIKISDFLEVFAQKVGYFKNSSYICTITN